MTAILQLHPISGPGICAPYRFLRQWNLRTCTNLDLDKKKNTALQSIRTIKDRVSSVISQNTLFCCSTKRERERAIMSLSSSPLPPPSSSSSNTSTPTTMRAHNLKHHYSQLGKVCKTLSSSSHQSSATSRMTGWEHEWQICKRADAAHQSHDFFTSVNNMHLNRYTDILASTFFLLCFCFCFFGPSIYLLWL